MLAVQNMEASGTIMKDQEIEFSALCGSLSMMSKGVWFYTPLFDSPVQEKLIQVLNDVLDLCASISSVSGFN